MPIRAATYSGGPFYHVFKSRGDVISSYENGAKMGQ